MGCGDIKEVLSTKPMVIGRESKGEGSQGCVTGRGFMAGGSRERRSRSHLEGRRGRDSRQVVRALSCLSSNLLCGLRRHLSLQGSLGKIVLMGDSRLTTSVMNQ